MNDFMLSINLWLEDLKKTRICIKINLINTFNHKFVNTMIKKKIEKTMYAVLSTIWKFDENIFHMNYEMYVNMLQTSK